MWARAISVTGCAAQADWWAGAEWARGAGCGAGSTGLRARRAGRAGPCERAGALAGGPKAMGARGVAWLVQLVRGKSGEWVGDSLGQGSECWAARVWVGPRGKAFWAGQGNDEEAGLGC